MVLLQMLFGGKKIKKLTTYFRVTAKEWRSEFVPSPAASRNHGTNGTFDNDHFLYNLPPMKIHR